MSVTQSHEREQRTIERLPETTRIHLTFEKAGVLGGFSILAVPNKTISQNFFDCYLTHRVCGDAVHIFAGEIPDDLLAGIGSLSDAVKAYIAAHEELN